MARLLCILIIYSKQYVNGEFSQIFDNYHFETKEHIYIYIFGVYLQERRNMKSELS